MSAFKRANYLTKASIEVLKTDKKLVLLPLISSVISLCLLAVIVTIIFLTGTRTGSLGINGGENFNFQSQESITLIALIVGFIINSAVVHFFEAIVYSAMQQRFAGYAPSLSAAYASARKKIRPILLFSLMMSTIGLALRALEERVPFAGKIAIWLFDAAWSIANVFAIPVILNEKEEVGPINATKKSVGIIKNVWGEGVIVQFSIGLVGLVWVIVAGLLAGLVGGILGALSAPYTVSIVVPIVLFVISIFAIATVLTTLATIVKAAVYQYATTGQSPDVFTKEVLQSTFTIKKSKKLFAGR